MAWVPFYSLITKCNLSEMPRILLIEPDRILAETYDKALASAGNQVITCASAQSAIMAADHEAPDIVILELQLVEHSGVEFLYEFRSYPEWQHVPIIIQTLVPPNEFSENRHLLKNELGVQQYLYKPRANLRDLLRAVNEATPIKS